MIEEVENHQYPLRAMVWPGCLIASIAHAIFVAKVPFMAHEQSWDGLNYNVQDSAGSRGTIAFAEDKNCFVGVSYLQTSTRNPLRSGRREANRITTFLRDVPDELKPLSEEALQYVLQDVHGQVMPVITAAFWSDMAGSRITSVEAWPDVVKHGAVLFEKQMLPPDVALKQWARDFEFDAVQIAFTDGRFLDDDVQTRVVFCG